jgi:hypothetical protein
MFFWNVWCRHCNLLILIIKENWEQFVIAVHDKMYAIFYCAIANLAHRRLHLMHWQTFGTLNEHLYGIWYRWNLCQFTNTTASNYINQARCFLDYLKVPTVWDTDGNRFGVQISNSPPSVSRLYRKCGSLDVSHLYGSLWPACYNDKFNFFYGLFNDVFSSLDCLALNSNIFRENWIRKYAKGTGLGIISCASLEFALEIRQKKLLRVPDRIAEIRI